jgi:hypothetical protein
MTNKRALTVPVNRWQPVFIEALREFGHVGKACQAAMVSRQTAYVHRRAEPQFAKEWETAIDDAAFTLEDEAWRRARDGVDEPIVHQGMIIGTQKKYSDTLLIFLLKGIKPDKYADKLVVRIDPEQAALLRKHGLTPSEAWLQLMQSLADEVVDAQR